jgi:hypothetical protein
MFRRRYADDSMYLEPPASSGVTDTPSATPPGPSELMSNRSSARPSTVGNRSNADSRVKTLSEQSAELETEVEEFLSSESQDVANAETLLRRIDAVLQSPRVLIKHTVALAHPRYNLGQRIRELRPPNSNASPSLEQYSANEQWVLVDRELPEEDSHVQGDPNQEPPEDSKELAEEVQKFVSSGSLNAIQAWALRNRINAVLDLPGGKGSDLALIDVLGKLQEVINKILKI